MAHVTLKRGDRLLLCSDGLHDYFPVEEEIAQKLSTDAPGDALKDMVELAKSRGGHDNITGVAVQVTDVIDAVPGALDRELTQPVEVHGSNPFNSDEPTETAVLDASGKPQLAGAPDLSQLRSTQPMRMIDDGEPAPAARSSDATADTTLDTEPVPAADQASPASPVTGELTTPSPGPAPEPEIEPPPLPAPEIEPARPDGEPPEPARVPRTEDGHDIRAAAGGNPPAGSEAAAAPAEIAAGTGRGGASGKKHDAG